MTSSPALSSYHSGNLRQILRQANVDSSRIASITRISIHPTHHARKRAAALGLTISVQKALKLDPKQISTEPLPVIDKVITPMDLNEAVLGRECELACSDRTALKCIVPQSASVYPGVDPANERLTCWFMTPIDVGSDVAQQLPDGVAVTYNPDYNVNMILCSPTEDGGFVQFTVKPAPLLDISPRPNDLNKFNHHLGIPVDVARPLSWASDLSSPGSLSVGSTSIASSHNPVTPHNANFSEKFMIRMKRKSAAIDDDEPEKPPKYERKGWTISQRRIVQRPIVSRSGRF